MYKTQGFQVWKIKKTQTLQLSTHINHVSSNTLYTHFRVFIQFTDSLLNLSNLRRPNHTTSLDESVSNSDFLLFQIDRLLFCQAVRKHELLSNTYNYNQDQQVTEFCNVYLFLSQQFRRMSSLCFSLKIKEADKLMQSEKSFVALDR